jgi:Protein of unknown function (DUF2934)
MRKPTNKPATKPGGPQGTTVQIDPPNGGDQEQIAKLAYQLWQTRGCPIGSPDQDWFQAEQQLQNQRS